MISKQTTIGKNLSYNANMQNLIREVQILTTDSAFLYLIVDKQFYRISWQNCSPLLEQATELERKRIEVSPSGYGLHWPLIDEDLAITPLLDVAEKIELATL